MEATTRRETVIPKLAYSLREAAEATSVSRRKLEYLIQQGAIKAVKIGRRTIIPTRELTRIAEKGAQ